MKNTRKYPRKIGGQKQNKRESNNGSQTVIHHALFHSNGKGEKHDGVFKITM